MVSTIIVRDATLAINGAPETRGMPEAHLRGRLDEVAQFDRKTFEDCAEVLSASAGGEESDPEVLEALMILGLSQPQLADELGVSAVAIGRRLASILERAEEPEYALSILELLAEHNPGHRAIERDVAALMRRQGLMQDLVDRYLERAQKLLKEKKNSEAIAWLREVLLLDRSRKDVARLIRDLRYEEVDEKNTRRNRVRVFAVVLVFSLLVSFFALREVRIRNAYKELPPSHETDLGLMKARLAGLEAFVEEHPFWHGAFAVVGERARLRVEIDRIEEAQSVELEKSDHKKKDRIERANLARERGLLRADSGDFDRALAEFRQALELASDDWPQAARVRRDIAAIEKHLAEENQ